MKCSSSAMDGGNIVIAVDRDGYVEEAEVCGGMITFDSFVNGLKALGGYIRRSLGVFGSMDE